MFRHAAMRGLLIVLPPLALGFCPAGFNGPSSHPPEWKIPEWPASMTEDEAGALRTVQLGGFDKAEVNEEYLEGPTNAFRMQNRETYWNVGGEYFLFFCQRFQKWRVAAISAFGNNMEGACYSFVSDGYPGRDIRNESLITGWIEVVEGEWKVQEKAGVISIGTMAEQLLAAAGQPEDSEDCVAEDDGTEELFADGTAKPRKSKCPVTRAATAVKVGLASFGKWVRRLFPKLLAAPEPEEEQPADEASQTTEAGEVPAKATKGMQAVLNKAQSAESKAEGKQDGEL